MTPIDNALEARRAELVRALETYAGDHGSAAETVIGAAASRLRHAVKVSASEHADEELVAACIALLERADEALEPPVVELEGDLEADDELEPDAGDPPADADGELEEPAAKRTRR